MNRTAEILNNGFQYFRQAVQGGSSDSRARARAHIRRRVALEFLVRLRDEITFKRNGFVWTGPPHCTITRAIFIDGRHQDVHIDLLDKWIYADRPVIVNVGANIGDTALPLSRTGKKVLAIEPSPETFARLQHNVRQNGLENVIICSQIAISKAEGTAELVIASQPGNSEILGDAGAVGFDGEDTRRGVVSVPTMPLDGVLKSLQIASDQVALVWSDTQGFESEVIESGAGLWANGVPLWVEVWPKALDCHGGTSRFVELCGRHFRQFLTAGKIHATPEPIEALESRVAELKQNRLATDMLFIP
jgi:FkbM family methyltransferase